jgi:hypothetical protein
MDGAALLSVFPLHDILRIFTTLWCQSLKREINLAGAG